MEKLLAVQEYDKIICNEAYKDDPKYRYLNEKTFKELVNFIHAFAGNEENADALDFFKIGFTRNVGEVISVKNYVGLIQMKNGFQIEILPKITMKEDETDITKEIFLKMLRSMKDFPSKVFNNASLKVAKMTLYEIFINMYLQDVRQLIKKGIKSSYINEEDNLKHFKGKLLISNHIKKNIAHKERFYVSFDEYQINRPENKLIKSTLLKLQKLSSSTENKKEIRQLLTSFEMVDVSTNYQKDFSRVVIDRNMKAYEMLMHWSKVFLMNKSFTTFSGDTNSRALLFPMEKVFESYVAENMKKVFIDTEWSVSSQDKGYYLFNEPRRQFALRPDIVMRNDDKLIVMDTKWKRLLNNPGSNYGISQADMYQMYAYAKKYNTNEIWLLYPMTEEMNNEINIGYTSDDGVSVNVYFVDLSDIENSLKELLSRL